MSRRIGKDHRKAKKTYSLSPGSVAFLETMKSKRNADSVSSILEEILQSVRREHERASVERAVAAYYDSLSDSEATEQVQWGEFALREFPGEERS
jgi:hypothetical protein